MRWRSSMKTCAQENKRASRMASSVCSRQNIATASSAAQTKSRMARKMLPVVMISMARDWPPLRGKWCIKRSDRNNPPMSNTPSKMRSISADGSVTEMGNLLRAAHHEAANQLAGTKRQHFIRKQADVNGAHRGPRRHAGDRVKHEAP